MKLSSFGSFSIRQKGRRIGRNPKTGEEVPILPRRVLVFRPSQVLKGRINAGQEGGRRGVNLLGRAGSGSGTPRRQVGGGLPDNRRGGERSRAAGARAALLGDQVPADQAAEAARRAAILPAGGRGAATPDPQPALHRRLHHQGRATAAAGRRGESPGAARCNRRFLARGPATREISGDQRQELRAVLSELQAVRALLRDRGA